MGTDAPDPAPPALVLCAHGTRSPAGAAAVADLIGQVADRRPELTVLPAYIDVQQPELAIVLRRLGGRPAVVVPLLLSAGFHVHVDLRRAVQSAVLTGGTVQAAGALGPDDALVAVLAERWSDAGGGTADSVVLAAAGSSDRRAIADVQRTATALAVQIDRPVHPGYLSAAAPTVAAAVAAARQQGARRVAVASYLLAPGLFADRIAEVDADLVTGPLLPHAALTDLVLRRFDESVSRRPPTAAR
jgi:sirohydrochlorin ferrochelatase